MKEEPRFFNYKKENSDYGYEAIQDFMLSYLLRWGDSAYKDSNSQLYEYGRNTLYFLIHGKDKNGIFSLDRKPPEDFKVTLVKTWRQWKLIDLSVEFIVEENSTIKKYALNIENKWYTSVRDNQLQKSKNHMNAYYKGREEEILNLVIFCDHTRLTPDIISFCKGEEYRCLTLEDIYSYSDFKETGNFIFDEFWFGFSKAEEA